MLSCLGLILRLWIFHFWALLVLEVVLLIFYTSCEFDVSQAAHLLKYNLLKCWMLALCWRLRGLTCVTTHTRCSCLMHQSWIWLYCHLVFISDSFPLLHASFLFPSSVTKHAAFFKSHILFHFVNIFTYSGQFGNKTPQNILIQYITS